MSRMKGAGKETCSHGHVLHRATTWLVCLCEWPYCHTVSLWGWAFLSGGGSINLWESLDQEKKKWDLSRLSSHLGSGTAWQLGFKTKLPQL